MSERGDLKRAAANRMASLGLHKLSALMIAEADVFDRMYGDAKLCPVCGMGKHECCSRRGKHGKGRGNNLHFVAGSLDAVGKNSNRTNALA